MTIQSPVSTGIVFVGIALRDYLMTEGKMTIARKTWLRIAFIFVGVGIGLYFFHTFFQ